MKQNLAAYSCLRIHLGICLHFFLGGADGASLLADTIDSSPSSSYFVVMVSFIDVACSSQVVLHRHVCINERFYAIKILVL